jgi:hydrogenase-4 component F
MGILILGIGIGGLATYGALLHLITNGLTKGVLFLSAGNIHRAYGSKIIDRVRGALHRVPLSAALFLGGFLAITGSPPFGPFVSEFTILNGAMSSGQYATGGAFLVLLGFVFVAIGATVLQVVQGPLVSEEVMSGDQKSEWSSGRVVSGKETDSSSTTHHSSLSTHSSFQDSIPTGAPILLMMTLVLLTGIYLPPAVLALLHEAAAGLEVQP